MIDYYKILGVNKNSTEQEIKQAYRKLAAQHHPDRGGDTKKFQEIQEAYSVLSDASKKAAYDNPAHPGPNFGFSFNHGPFEFNAGDPFGDIFSQVFGGRYRQDPRPQPTRVSLWITLKDIYEGGKRIIGIGNSNVEINLPVGVSDGENVRYPKLGPGGTDLVIQFRLKPDTLWQKQEFNLIKEESVPVWDLILGAEIKIQNINGEELAVALPANTQFDTVLRLKGRGFPSKTGVRGDMLVKLKPVLPEKIAPELIDAIRQYRAT